MKTVESVRRLLQRPDRLSYVFMLLLLAMTAWLDLGSLLLAAFFSYFTLNMLSFNRRVSKWLAALLFVALVFGVIYGLGVFVRHGIIAFPAIAEKALPSFIQWAKANGMEPAFTDYDTFRDAAMDMIRSQIRHLGSFARFAEGAGKQLLFVIAGCVAAVSLFLNSQFELGRDPHIKPNNLYSLAGAHLGDRFQMFYQSFARVMGAQIIISAVNTFLTAIFAVAVNLPYTPLVIGVTFLCGLLPVVGNLISNTIIVGIGFTVSPKLAIIALVFLIVIHKLEYFLNSTIIGRKIRNPLWLTLIGLVVGERLMGIPGMVLAPVILHYIKSEASSIEIKSPGTMAVTEHASSKAAVPRA